MPHPTRPWLCLCHPQFLPFTHHLVLFPHTLSLRTAPCVLCPSSCAVHRSILRGDEQPGACTVWHCNALYGIVLHCTALIRCIQEERGSSRARLVLCSLCCKLVAGALARFRECPHICLCHAYSFHACSFHACSFYACLFLLCVSRMFVSRIFVSRMFVCVFRFASPSVHAALTSHHRSSCKWA